MEILDGSINAWSENNELEAIVNMGPSCTLLAKKNRKTFWPKDQEGKRENSKVEQCVEAYCVSEMWMTYYLF